MRELTLGWEGTDKEIAGPGGMYQQPIEAAMSTCIHVMY
jgi:hypothetical protein